MNNFKVLVTREGLSVLTHVTLSVTPWTAPARLLRPSVRPWGSPGKNPGVGCHSLLQGIFPTQESHLRHLCLLHWQAWEATNHKIKSHLKPFLSKNGTP